jgi:hypothetical protein
MRFHAFGSQCDFLTILFVFCRMIFQWEISHEDLLMRFLCAVMRFTYEISCFLLRNMF